MTQNLHQLTPSQMMTLIHTQQTLLTQLGYNGSGTLGQSNVTPANATTPRLVVYYPGANIVFQPAFSHTSPPGFFLWQLTNASLMGTYGVTNIQPGQHVSLMGQHQVTGPVNTTLGELGVGQSGSNNVLR